MAWHPACPGPNHNGTRQSANEPLFLASPAAYQPKHRKAQKMRYACAACWSTVRVPKGRQLTAADIATPAAFRKALDSTSNRAIGPDGVGPGR